jgi:HEAT repeat protein
MPRSNKSSTSKSSSSKKKHTAVPPKGGVAEAPAPEAKVAQAKEQVKEQAKEQAANKTLKISVSEPAVKHADGAKQTEADKHTAHTHPAHVAAAIVSAAQPVADKIATGPSEKLQALLAELDSHSASARVAAASEIGRTGDRHAGPALITALRDSDADVAREAATSLGLLGDRSAVDSLIEVLNDANGYYHSVVRAAAAQALGQLKDTRAVNALLVALTDPIAEPSVEAIRALTALNDRRAISALIDVVRNRSGFFVATVRRAAVLGLAHFGGEDAIAQLRFVAADEWEDNVIRDEADAAVRRPNA